MKTRTVDCVVSKFNDIKIFTFPMKVKDVAFLAYTAVRGVDDEEGAVQRVLSTKRINSIRDYVLGGQGFINTFILNWTYQAALPKYVKIKREISIPVVASAAQLIDGQHRLAGLEAAMKMDSKIGDRELLVSITVGLTTPQAAAIFLNINSEQKPVPRSLIYDLFGEVDNNPDHLINRASDIADELNASADSPYLQLIEYPGTARGVGSIDLSTVVTSLKPLLGTDGAFSKIKIKNLALQKQVIMNYFKSVKFFYDKDGLWENKGANPFLKAAGFSGALDFLGDTLLLKCSEKKSFTEDTFRNFLKLDQDNLLLLSDIKNMDGKTAKKNVRDYLESNLSANIPDQDEYEI